MTAVTALPFVEAQANGQPSNLWAVTPSGAWSADNDTGVAYAEALMDHMARNGQPMLLGYVIKAIAEAGVWTGIECGFCHSIALRTAAA